MIKNKGTGERLEIEKSMEYELTYGSLQSEGKWINNENWPVSDYEIEVWIEGRLLSTESFTIL